MTPTPPEANMLGAMVPFIVCAVFALITATIFENKNAQTFIRGVIMFLSLVIIEIPLLLYLRQTGVDIPGAAHVFVWSVFAAVSMMAAISWR